MKESSVEPARSEKSPGPWSPLEHPTFREVWTASVVSNVGTWMQSVSAAWLMTQLTPSALMVALVQTATTLPSFFLGYIAGTIADLFDRRRYLLFAQSWLMVTAFTLSMLTFAGLTGPWTLLACTFSMGIGAALNGPAWVATIPELVPREKLSAAVALNSVGFNIARAIGPALAGMVVATTRAGTGFLLNAFSYVGVLIALTRWQGKPKTGNANLDSVLPAMKDGVKWARGARDFRSILIRTAMFTFPSSALWALLPVVAKQLINSTAVTYGVLLGCLGAGSLAGAYLLTRLRHMWTPDRVINFATACFVVATLAAAGLNRLDLLCLGMLIGGIGWLCTMSTFNVSAQTVPPSAMRARALSFYLLAFQSTMALGSFSWGVVANHWGVPVALYLAAIAMLPGIVVSGRVPVVDPLRVPAVTKPA
jgi:MFS family permease